MKTFAIPLLLALAASPSWALYKCVAGGKTTFQEQPCDGGQQTNIKPMYDAAPINANAPTKSTVQSASELEQERKGFEASYRLRDRLNDLDNERRRCEAEVRAVAARRGAYNDNLAGAMRGQAEAAAAGALATSCDTRVRSVEADVQELRRQCTELKCKPV